MCPEVVKDFLNNYTNCLSLLFNGYVSHMDYLLILFEVLDDKGFIYNYDCLLTVNDVLSLFKTVDLALLN